MARDYEFSIEFFVDKHDGMFEIDDKTTIGDTPHVVDDVNFEYSGIKDDIIEEMDKRGLKDGQYHGYVRGAIVYESSYCWEYGTTDLDSIVTIDRYNFYPLNIEEAS